MKKIWLTTGIITAFVWFMFFSYCSIIPKENVQVRDTIKTNKDKTGTHLTIEVRKGASYNHPTMAIWIENLEGELVQTVYVTKSLATGVYGHGDMGNGKWKDNPGVARRPATLPYFLHKRNIKAEDGLYLPTPDKPIPDAYTGATPKNNFIVSSPVFKDTGQKFRVLLEINQTWDWNDYWTNNKYPDNDEYKTSCQPSVVYAVRVDLQDDTNVYFLNPVGHGHYAGENGKLYTDLSTLTTALQIVGKAKVTINK